MENISTDTPLSPRRASTQRCDQDSEPPPSKKAKLDTQTLKDSRPDGCEGQEARCSPSNNPGISGTAERGASCDNTHRNPGARPRESGPNNSSLLPLSPADVAKFEEDGYVMLCGAFDAEVASACRDHLWRRLQLEGITMQNPSTWVKKKPIGEIYGLPSSPENARGHPWTAALSPRLKAAVNQLLGADAWEDFGCGWWMMTFPGFDEPPWRADGTWHVDGANFRHYPHRYFSGSGTVKFGEGIHAGKHAKRWVAPCQRRSLSVSGV